MRTLLTLGTLVLVVACGGSYVTALTASPSAGPADVIACARAKLDSLGYRVLAFDQEENRVTVQKFDPEVRRPNPQFHRNVDRIEAHAVPAAAGTTSLTVTARTFAEFETHRGPTEEEEGASAAVKSAAQAVVDACGRS
jgi:hypothetical protein